MDSYIDVMLFRVLQRNCLTSVLGMDKYKKNHSTCKLKSNTRVQENLFVSGRFMAIKPDISVWEFDLFMCSVPHFSFSLIPRIVLLVTSGQ